MAQTTAHCYLCGAVKPKSCFHKDRHRGAGVSSKCRDCSRKQIGAKHLVQWRNKHLSMFGKHLVATIKAHFHCQVCGETEAIALDYHHVFKKSFPIARYPHAREIARLSLKSEMEKCIVLCANCHRKHHAGILDVSNIPTLKF